MNEYCLLEIFELLSLMDLCSLAEACKEFRNVALRLAPKELTLSKMAVVLFQCRTDRWPIEQSYKPEEVARIFKNFGSSLTAVSITGFDRLGKHLTINLVAKFCGPNLKSLQVNGVALFKGTKEFLSIAEKMFPQLERFGYKTPKTLVTNPVEDEESEHPLELLTDFIGRHSTLKRLSLGFFKSDDNCTRRVFQTINECKALEKLVLEYGNYGNKCFLRHPLHQLTSLTALTVSSFELVDIDFFSSLTTLRVLRIDNCLVQDSEHCPKSRKVVIGIVTILFNLEELEIWAHNDTWILDRNTFATIASIVRPRPNGLILKCGVDFDAENLDETNRSVKLILTRWNRSDF